MPTKRLTDAFIRTLRPPRKPTQVSYFHTLERGLALVLTVSYGGTKSFAVLTYDASGRALTERLGVYPKMSLAEATKQARAKKADPALFAAQRAVGNFAEIAEEFLRRHVEKSKLRSATEIKRCLNKYVLPVWGSRPFLEIRRRDVASLLDDIADANGPRQADMVLAILSKLMRWYQARDDAYTSPIVPGMKQPEGGEARSRILSDDEIRAVWKATEDCATFDVLVRLLLLTGQRREKVASMRWADLIEGEWRIPSEAREKTNAGTLKLPQVVLDLIANQPSIQGNDHVFASTKGSGPFNSWSEKKATLDAKLPSDMGHWVLHDLRRTARSLLSRAGVPSDHAERLLGHKIGGVQRVYDRHGYVTEKADALRRLADLVDRIVQPHCAAETNFVTLTMRAAN